jgi:CheY-like chemotaxis protein
MKRILIVEDDQLVATAYRKRFKDAGWEVEWAPDGVEGLKAVGNSLPDVVLLDLLMPRLDGIEVLKFIRGHPELRHLPVVVFSNSYMTNLIENAWRAGADQCLMKASTTPQSLFDSIAKAMQKAAARKSAESSPVSGPPRPAGIIPHLVPAAKSLFVEPIRASGGSRPPSVPAVQPLPNATAPVSADQPWLAIPPSAPASASLVEVRVPANPAPEVAPPAAKPGTPSSGDSASGPVIDPEFQAQIRQLFVAGAPAKMELVRGMVTALPPSSQAAESGQLTELFRKVHSLTGNAAVAGCPAIAHHASTFEAFLQELQQKPRFINASTLRTIQSGLDFVSLLFQHALDGEPPELPRRVLIVDGDPMSGQAIALTLEKAGLRTHLAGDPIEAMTWGSTENFNLIVAAADLPGMSGFEACAQLQTLTGCAGVPVLFVSSTEQFAAHAHPGNLGENDIIARPFLIIELTLKAMILLETRRFRSHFATAA